MLKSPPVKAPFPADAPDTVSWKFWKAFEKAGPENEEKPGLLKADVSSVKVAVAEAPLLNCAPDHSAWMLIRSARETCASERTAAAARISVFVFMGQSVVELTNIDASQVCPELFYDFRQFLVSGREQADGLFSVKSKTRFFGRVRMGGVNK